MAPFLLEETLEASRTFIPEKQEKKRRATQGQMQ